MEIAEILTPDRVVTGERRGEFGIFGEKSVAGMDCVGAGFFRG